MLLFRWHTVTRPQCDCNLYLFYILIIFASSIYHFKLDCGALRWRERGREGWGGGHFSIVQYPIKRIAWSRGSYKLLSAVSNVIHWQNYKNYIYQNLDGQFQLEVALGVYYQKLLLFICIRNATNIWIFWTQNLYWNTCVEYQILRCAS